MITQTEHFTSEMKMNKWLRENKIKPVDIKMTATQMTVHYLVIYEESDE